MTGRRVRRPTLFSLWRKARRETVRPRGYWGLPVPRFALHGWQRRCPGYLPLEDGAGGGDALFRGGTIFPAPRVGGDRQLVWQ